MKIVYRGNKTRFQASFLDDGTVLAPKSNEYPSFNIISPEGVSIASGVGLPDDKPGSYYIEWTPSKTLPLSTDQKKYLIQWLFVSSDNRQLIYTESFDLVDTDSLDYGRSYQTVYIAGKDFSVSLRLDYKPYKVTLDIYDSSMVNKIVDEAVHPGDIEEVIDDQGYLYIYNVDSYLVGKSQEYIAVWEVRRSKISKPEFLYEKIVCITPKHLKYIPDIRMLIDKFQKRLGRRHAYEDEDIVNYIDHGLGIVNLWHPQTSWSLQVLPREMDTYLVACSCWYALNAQYLLEVDHQFSFTGQTVTLEVDRTSGIDSSISRLMEFINTGMSKTKLALVRASTPMGVVALRPARPAIINRVFRIHEGFITPSVMELIYAVFG